VSAPVWLACAALAEGDGVQAPDWLSASERARLAAVSAPGRRAQFVAGRRLARRLLAEAFGGEAFADWALDAAPDAPPRVLRGPSRAAAAARVAITHSAELVACAVSAVDIGLDLECPRRPRELGRLAEAVCCDDERRLLAALDPEARQAAFDIVWTLKEAWFKRRGEGLDPGRLPRLRTRAGPGEGRVWQLPGITLALLAPVDAELRLPWQHAVLAVGARGWSVGPPDAG